jgi:hypothetical protein
MEFHPSHHTALTLAGTVALPSPYPACGAVSVVIARDGEDYVIFIKIVQVVGDKRIITRFVRSEDIRAIRGNPDGTIGDGPDSWPVLGIKKIKGELDKRTTDLTEKAKSTGVLDEAPWYEAAIVHVAEAAPVLHRDEVGVTAAVSCEEVAFSARGSCGWSGCCNISPGAHHAVGSSGICCHIAAQPQAPGRRAGIDQ